MLFFNKIIYSFHCSVVTGVIIKVEPAIVKRNSQKFDMMKNTDKDKEDDNTPLRCIFSNMSDTRLRVLFWGEKKKEFDGKLLHKVRNKKF